MTAQIITFDNSIKCVRQLEIILGAKIHASNFSGRAIVFDQEIDGNPGICFEEPYKIHGNWNDYIDSFFSVYIDDKFSNDFVGLYAFKSYIIVATI